MEERTYKKERNSINFQATDPLTLYYEIDLNQNFRSKYKNCSHHANAKVNIQTVFPNDESTRVNELGWMVPSQPDHFPFKKRDDSALQYA